MTCKTEIIVSKEFLNSQLEKAERYAIGEILYLLQRDLSVEQLKTLLGIKVLEEKDLPPRLLLEQLQTSTTNKKVDKL